MSNEGPWGYEVPTDCLSDCNVSLKPPKRKHLEINKYANTNYAIYTVKKFLHEEVERAAENLKTTPETLDHLRFELLNYGKP